ncbi:hypothetical protein JRQ81_009694 [Phrynocephalus forsythii]|uniref:F-box domain-containing protein n=1 Tax=Phrynocephalus forsythii TaxID=171643 RepID=A0A9Q1ARY3_9SAUR|nr:hypothetical protein JRQ81_009694 [Phrynocephalus forsythii]
MDFWETGTSSEGQWEIQTIPEEEVQMETRTFDDPAINKCFSASKGLCVKSQRITLKDHGYWEDLMDTARLLIKVEDFLCSDDDNYQLTVKLLSADNEVLKEYCTQGMKYPAAWQRWQWALHIFNDYPSGIRHILFQHQGGGMDGSDPKRNTRVTRSSIMVSHSTYYDESFYLDDYYDQHDCYNSSDEENDDYYDGTSSWWALPGLEKEMASLEDLPEPILVDILTWLPAEDLILNCRLVCSWWRELVDWPVLWKRKLRRHGKDLGAQGSDLYYVFCHLEKNLVQNPCGEEGLDFWEILTPGEARWKIEDVSEADSEKFRGTDFLQRNYYVKDRPQPLIQKCFAASNGSCFKSQLITLKDHGYWDELLDGSSSTIVVKDWFYSRPGCRYRLYVGLLAADATVLREYCSEDLYKQDWERGSSQRWQKVTHTFYNCPRVRHIVFQHQAQKVVEVVEEETAQPPGDGIRITHSSAAPRSLWRRRHPHHPQLPGVQLSTLTHGLSGGAAGPSLGIAPANLSLECSCHILGFSRVTMSASALWMSFSGY